MGIRKVHHGIMKADALTDYERTKAYCEKYGMKVFEPKGKHWHKIEDATALMLKQFGEDHDFDTGFRLHRGITYYQTLIKLRAE